MQLPDIENYLGIVDQSRTKIKFECVIILFIFSSTSSSSHGRKMFSPSSSSAAVDYCVSQIASNEIKLAITALKELEDHFRIKGPAVWLKHLNQVSFFPHIREWHNAQTSSLKCTCSINKYSNTPFR